MVLSQREEEEEESPRVSFGSDLIFEQTIFIARRVVVSHLQQIVAVDEISVSITKRIDIGPLCKFDISLHEITVAR